MRKKRGLFRQRKTMKQYSAFAERFGGVRSVIGKKTVLRLDLHRLYLT
jgi:hypothetical protein